MWVQNHQNAAYYKQQGKQWKNTRAEGLEEMWDREEGQVLRKLGRKVKSASPEVDSKKC